MKSGCYVPWRQDKSLFWLSGNLSPVPKHREMRLCILNHKVIQMFVHVFDATGLVYAINTLFLTLKLLCLFLKRRKILKSFRNLNFLCEHWSFWFVQNYTVKYREFTILWNNLPRNILLRVLCLEALWDGNDWY